MPTQSLTADEQQTFAACEKIISAGLTPEEQSARRNRHLWLIERQAGLSVLLRILQGTAAIRDSLADVNGMLSSELDSVGTALKLIQEDERVRPYTKYQRRVISDALRFSVFERDKNECHYCGVKHNLSVDHIVPVSAGGSDDIENLVTACGQCNSRKGYRSYHTYIETLLQEAE